MDSGVLRDFVIIITGGLMLVLIIITGIIGFLIYRQITKLIKSVKTTLLSVKEVSSEVKEAFKSSKDFLNIIKNRPEEPEKKAEAGSGS